MEFHSCINYLLTVAQHEVFMVMSTRLAPFGITPGQYGVLKCLWDKGTASPSELAQSLVLENSAISGLLDRMQKKGLIDRHQDLHNRRSVQVVATPLGRSLKNDVLQAVEDVNIDVLQSFTAEEQAQLTGYLRRIAGITTDSESG